MSEPTKREIINGLSEDMARALVGLSRTYPLSEQYFSKSELQDSRAELEMSRGRGDLARKVSELARIEHNLGKANLEAAHAQLEVLYFSTKIYLSYVEEDLKKLKIDPHE